MKNKVPPVLSLFRCYSTLFLNAQQAYLNNHISTDGIDHGGHTMEAATAEACKTVAEAQRDADAAYHEPLIQQAKEEAAREIFKAYDAYIESLGKGLSELTQLIISQEREHRAKIQSLKDRKW